MQFDKARLLLARDSSTAQDQPAAAILNAKAAKSQGKSLESFLASLTVAGAVFLLEVLLYVWLRRRLPSIYKPKTEARISRDKSFESAGMHRSDCDIITECGLDAYLFLRYLKVLLKIFVPLAMLILPTLIPLNLIGGRGVRSGVSGLDQFSWTNVSAEHTNRYWAHLSLALLVVLWVSRITRLELLTYTRLRHKWLASSDSLDGTSTTTILVTDIPETLLSVEQLYSTYNVYPFGVRKVSINRDLSELVDKIVKREQCVLALEASETTLIKRAQLSHSRRSKGRQNLKWSKPISGAALWKQYLDAEQRPTIRIPPLWASWMPPIPFVGKVVDEINHRRRELSSLNGRILEAQQLPDKYRDMNSALVQFNHPIGAHMACQVVQHFRPHTMIARQIEGSSDNVLWQYVSMGWWEHYVRTFTVGSMIGILIAISTVPVAFTGLLSQISYLIAVFPRLRWLESLPGWTLATLQGVMPACLLATVMIVLPLILYRLVEYQGIHTRIDAELLMQDYYFYFLFLQLFLVVSISSSIVAVLDGLTHDFTSLAALIAQNLPKAGNYFLSYMLLQGLSVSAGTLLQIGRLVFFFVGLMLDNTARQRWVRQVEPVMRWGTFFPVYTNLAVIGLIYSVISPLILVFNIVTFTLFLMVQRYNIINLAASHMDTGGLVYPKAINQLFVGLYVMELYLIGLFFLVRDENGRVACTGQGLIMIIATFLTAAYQVLLGQAFKPLSRHLPVVLDSTEPSKREAKGLSGEPARPNPVQRLINILTKFHDQGAEEEKMALAAISDVSNGDIANSRSQSPVIEDKSLTASQTTIWLPRDDLGISGDEIRQTHGVSTSISISDENAEMSDRAAVHCYAGPPLALKD